MAKTFRRGGCRSTKQAENILLTTVQPIYCTANIAKKRHIGLDSRRFLPKTSMKAAQMLFISRKSFNYLSMQERKVSFFLQSFTECLTFAAVIRGAPPFDGAEIIPLYLNRVMPA